MKLFYRVERLFPCFEALLWFQQHTRCARFPNVNRGVDLAQNINVFCCNCFWFGISCATSWAGEIGTELEPSLHLPGLIQPLWVVPTSPLVTGASLPHPEMSTVTADWPSEDLTSFCSCHWEAVGHWNCLWIISRSDKKNLWESSTVKLRIDTALLKPLSCNTQQYSWS